MPLKEPQWWYRHGPGWQGILLAPAALIYGAVAARRLASSAPYQPKLPVVCVGNFTAGGTGKTPMSLALADLAEELGFEPWFLTRGYGGRLTEATIIDDESRDARDTGDEPLLLARRAPVVVASDRAAGARLIEHTAPHNALIIMDDGLQNPGVAKDFVLALVDGARGLGNGRVIPAGPLRAPLSAQAPLADMIAITGEAASAGVVDVVVDRVLQARGGKPLAAIRVTTQATDTGAALTGRPVLAYAGIANPDRFFRLLEHCGARVVERRAFPDHKRLTHADAAALLAAAKARGLTLVTTEKDLVRLNGAQGALAELRAQSQALAIAATLNAEDRETLKAHLANALRR